MVIGQGPLPRRLIVFGFAGFAWALWTCRNKIEIKKMLCIIVHAEMELSTQGGGQSSGGRYEVALAQGV